MIVDSSAVVAVLKGEIGSAEFESAMGATSCRMSVANWLEASMVADNLSPSSARRFDEVVSLAGIDLVPVSVEHGRLAREAHRRFGRGSGSRARLNFGDCFAYALSVTTGEPLLFKGDDFTHTDVVPALG